MTRKRKKKQKTIVLFKRKHVRNFLVLGLAIVIVVQASVLVESLFQSTQPSTVPQAPSPITRPQSTALSLDGYEQVEVTVSPAVMYLTAGCRQLAMVTTEFQTYSINNGLQKRIDVRPTTHDVFKDMIENFGFTVQMVKVEAFKDSIYYAKLFVQEDSKVLGLDSRPSDAIAVAVRFDAPIYVHSDILAQYGKDVC